MTDTLNQFLNIWEIPDHLKCPVLGAILTVEKHRSILKKCGYDVKSLKPYEFHQKIMLKLGEENNVSLKVNNFIRNQSARQMTRIAGMQEPDIRALWADHLENGDTGPLFYAIVSHRKTSPELLADISGDVHMQSHANMTEIFDIRRQMNNMSERLDREKSKLAETSLALREMGKLRKTDAAEIRELTNQNRQLAVQIGQLCPDPSIRIQKDTEKKRAEEKIQTLAADLEQEKKAFQTLMGQHKALQIELFSTRNELELVKKQFQSLVSGYRPCSTAPCGTPGADTPQAACSKERCSKETCTRYRLCAKRIFLVGGMTKMRAFYKEVIENAGGEFHYHDGYMKNASTSLEANVKRCDLVLCPVNCNSHNACRKVKQLCSRHNKPLKILSSASLSAVSQALFEPDSTVTLN